MKMGKKIVIGFGILLVVITAVYFLWPDPIKKDIKLFVEEYNASILNCYDVIQTEAQKITSYTLVSEFEYSVEQVMIPEIDDTISKVQAIPLQTAEVMVMRNKYVDLMKNEKNCYQKLVYAVKLRDQGRIDEVYNLINDIETLRVQYDQEFTELAKEHGVFLVRTTRE